MTRAIDIAERKILTGTTAQRPASGSNGQQYYNTTTGRLELYNTLGGWKNADESGLQFSIQYLIAAGGGGGGGATRGAGGGAGGLLTGNSTIIKEIVLWHAVES